MKAWSLAKAFLGEEKLVFARQKVVDQGYRSGVLRLGCNDDKSSDFEFQAQVGQS